MQENRSFDHYYGTMRGVRGFGDRGVAAAAQRPGHLPPARSRARRRRLPAALPRRHAQGGRPGPGRHRDHNWNATHQAWDSGAWNEWAPAKSELTMAYFTDADIPFQRALGRGVHRLRPLLLLGPGPDHAQPPVPLDGHDRPGRRGRRPGDRQPGRLRPVYTWTTYPERLQDGRDLLAGLRQRRGRRRRRRRRLGRRLRRQPAVAVPGLPRRPGLD